MPDRARIAIRGGASAWRESLREALCGAGLTLLDGDGAEERADLVVLCPGSATPDSVREECERHPERTVLVSAPLEQAERFVEAGAADVLEPGLPERLLVRRVSTYASGIAVQRAGHTLAAIEEVLARGVEPSTALRECCDLLADALNLASASLVLLGGDDAAIVIAGTASDEGQRNVHDLGGAPAVRDAMSRAGETAVDLDEATAEGLGLGPGPMAALVLPLHWGNHVIGALLLGRRSPSGAFGHGLRFFARLAADVLVLAVADGTVLERFREKTNRTNVRAYEAERLARAIEAHREFFEGSSDGMFVLDSECTVLHANGAAQAITGFRADGLVGKRLIDLVTDTQREGLAQIVGKAAGGTSFAAFDLHLATTSGDLVIVSASTSAALAEHGAVVLSFRDVTEARGLDYELRKTKDFLERLIDSTVDAIVSADVRGTILLFNKGAERIYGWAAEEVVGKLMVERLYAPGVAHSLMRQLRSADYGGVGRLELSRREIVTKTGEVVPVNLTASIIYEDGREVATVGIFTDLRERIGIEERLALAQEKLQISERQAVLAELAGTTAHELNQPLTSIMGYAELVRRKLVPTDPPYRAVDTILREAERMADIVRKIGKITRYETKEYVGQTQILDLDRSAPTPAGGTRGAR